MEQGHGAGEGFPAFVVCVDVADIVDVCALRAGIAVGGAVPMACQSVELGQASSSSVEDGDLGLDNMRAAME